MENLGSPNLTVAEQSLVSEKEQQGIRSAQNTLGRAIDGTLKVIVGSALFGELGVVFFNILGRTFGRSMTWALEVAELALSVIAFVGGALAYRRGQHAIFSTLIEALPYRYRRACYAFMEYLVLTVAILMGLYSLPLFIAQWEVLTPILQIRVSWFSLPLLVGMIVIAITAIERLLPQHRPTVLAVGIGFSALVLLCALTRDTWLPFFSGDAPVIGALALFLIPVMLGLPIGFAMLIGTIAYLLTAGTLPMVVLGNTMVNGTTNFVLLALPFFILAANVMIQGGISRRLVHLVHSCVGHFRGGVFQVMVVSMYIVSGLSGSKTADVAAVASVMMDMLRRGGHRLEQGAAVLTASSVMGETVPPSIAILVLASATTLSTGALFVGGIIPAAVIAVCLMVLIFFQARGSHAERRPSLRDLGDSALGGILPLIMPVILIGGIVFGIATPTEVSSFAVIYGIVLAGFIYHELGFRAFVSALIDSASVSGMILFILAAAKCFAWVITIAQLPQRLVAVLSGMHATQILFMLALIPFLVLVGMIVEGLPALIILAPILMPIVSHVGINPLHFGIVLIIATGLGCYLPPIGLGFFVVCAICETEIEKSARAMIPYIIVLCLGLLLVALVPWFTLYLPAKFHLAG